MVQPSLTELGSRPRLRSTRSGMPVLFALGLLASYAEAPRNLGFMAETEKQVEEKSAPGRGTPAYPAAEQDARSRQIVQKMKDDGPSTIASAETASGVPLPWPSQGRHARAMSGHERRQRIGSEGGDACRLGASKCCDAQ